MSHSLHCNLLTTACTYISVQLRCPALLTPPSLRALKPSCQPFTVRQRRHSHCAHVQRCVSQAKQNDRNIQLPGETALLVLHKASSNAGSHLDLYELRFFAGLLRVANVVTNSAASLVPSSVPRPVAKAGVIGVTSLIALWLFGKVWQA